MQVFPFIFSWRKVDIFAQPIAEEDEGVEVYLANEQLSLFLQSRFLPLLVVDVQQGSRVQS